MAATASVDRVPGGYEVWTSRMNKIMHNYTSAFESTMHNYCTPIPSSTPRTVKQQDATGFACSSFCGIAERECKQRL